jgi:hypothetical protein
VNLFFQSVQFEFTHAIGPHAARYIVDPTVVGDQTVAGGRPAADGDDDGVRAAVEARNRGAAGITRGIGTADVLVIGVVGAPVSQPRLLRRSREAKPGEATEVPLSLATFVKGSLPFGEEREAKQRFDAIRFSEVKQATCAQEALTVLNVAVRAHRVGAHDPYAIEVTRRDARRVRIGYGTTEDVQKWSLARRGGAAAAGWSAVDPNRAAPSS